MFHRQIAYVHNLSIGHLVYVHEFSHRSLCMLQKVSRLSLSHIPVILFWLFSLLHPLMRVSCSLSNGSFIFHPFNLVSLPRFMCSYFHAIRITLHGPSSCVPTILVFVAKPTATVASHGVTMSRNVSHFITSPTS
jgi:hypothetical protein